MFYEEMFGLQEKQKEEKRKKRNWENRFQTWCNKESRDGSTSFGKCGYGVFCDYCSENSYGRPCVRALNELIKDTGVRVDYETADFCDIWIGKFSED